MAYQVIDVSPLDAIAKPLFDALLIEYSTRYKAFRPDSLVSAAQELARYPAELFAPPEGAFVVIVHDGETVGGGGFKRYDVQTAELKRMWTRADQRRRGVGRRIVEALEARAIRQGYRRVYMTTGFKQPEAKALYIRAGYEPLFDQAIDPAIYRSLRFARDLVVPGRTSEFGDLRYPDPLPENWAELMANRWAETQSAGN